MAGYDDRKGEGGLAAISGEQAGPPLPRALPAPPTQQRRTLGQSAAYLVGGSVIAVASLLLAPLPGPGMPTVLLGLGMVAGEFRPGARLLDRGEVRARRLARWVGGVWRRSSAAGKALVVSVGAICAAAGLYVAYLLLFGG
jgi:hypothetical protein